MLTYDYYKEKNLISNSLNLEQGDGLISWECSGGEGVFLDATNNNLIPKRYRNEDGGYDILELVSLNYYLAPEDMDKNEFLQDKLELDLFHLTSKKRARIQAPYKAKIEALKAEMEQKTKIALEAYDVKARKKLGLPPKEEGSLK